MPLCAAVSNDPQLFKTKEKSNTQTERQTNEEEKQEETGMKNRKDEGKIIQRKMMGELWKDTGTDGWTD
jgi:hypothetical protein